MSDSKQARVLLEAARRDLRALEGMRDSAVFADEIFGFHAQQAAEKLLKAWLAIEGVLYPRTHDLDHLLRLLEQHGAQLSGFEDLEEYSAFAVQLRYEAFDTDAEPLDRDVALERIRRLVNRIGGLLTSPEGE